MTTIRIFLTYIPIWILKNNLVKSVISFGAFPQDLPLTDMVNLSVNVNGNFCRSSLIGSKVAVPHLQPHLLKIRETFHAGHKNDGYAIVQAIVAWPSAAEYTFNSVRPFDMI